MKKHITHIVFAAASSMILGACEENGEPEKPDRVADSTDSSARKEREQPKAPDNTAHNERDRSGATLTPPDQSESATDVRITSDVRKALIEDSAMSMNAKNIKVVTQGGVVTLRGVVDSRAESDAVQAKAEGVTGVVRVDNQLEVKAG